MIEKGHVDSCYMHCPPGRGDYSFGGAIIEHFNRDNLIKICCHKPCFLRIYDNEVKEDYPSVPCSVFYSILKKYPQHCVCCWGFIGRKELLKCSIKKTGDFVFDEKMEIPEYVFE